MSLEELEKELYRSKSGIKQRPRKPSVPKTLPEEKTAREAVPQTWAEEKTEEESVVMPSVWVKRIILGGILFGVLVVGGGILFISFSRNGSVSDIDIQIYSVREIYRGVPLEVSLDIDNGSANILKDATLTLSSTPGLTNLNAPNNNILNEDLGDFGIGSLSKKSYKLLASGDANSVQKITVTLSYVLTGGTRYEVKKTAEILIKNSAIRLAIEKPDQILSGSAFEFVINYQNDSSFDFPAVILEVKYPDAFRFISASLEPNSLNNHWQLGELASGSKGSFKIKGTLSGASGEAFNLSAAIFAGFSGKDYELATEPLNLAIAASPVKIQATVNGRTDYIARLGDTLTYTIQYQNLSGIALADVVINADLIGEMLDFSSLRTNANQNSITHRLTWNASNVQGLRLLDPGSSGAVSFEIKLKNQYPAQRLNDKNFTLRLNVSFDSPSVPYYLSASKTEAGLNMDTKVAGLTLIQAKAFYRDADAGILNSGVLPPKVGTPTQFTVHWIITNYATDVENIEVRAFLQSGVAWTGQVKSNIDSVPLYNERTNEVAWTIPKINATKGVLSDPVEAIFQVAIIPNVSQVGDFAPLLSQTNMKVTDSFVELNLSSAAPALSTNLIADITVGRDEGRVIP